MIGNNGVNQMSTALALPSAPSKCAYLPKSMPFTPLLPLIFRQLAVRTALVAVDLSFVRASNMLTVVPAMPCLNKRKPIKTLIYSWEAF